MLLNPKTSGILLILFSDKKYLNISNELQLIYRNFEIQNLH